MSPKSNQVVITLVSFLTYFVLSSMLAPIGILSGPMAEHFGQSITDVTKQFSWLTGGILVGAVIALFIFDWTSLRKLFITIYGLVALVLLSLVTVDSLESARYILAFVGV
ncbi:MAG: MFS transporter TsgA, partial [Gammaproteobacteria bacterium]|nr:MFS transporter TsgA [Gammaproteobacteria bacterium]